jgi:hypothetical protein
LRYTERMTKRTAKKTTKPVSKKEAFEPNKMTFVVATLSVVTLVLLAMIVTFS